MCSLALLNISNISPVLTVRLFRYTTRRNPHCTLSDSLFFEMMGFLKSDYVPVFVTQMPPFSPPFSPLLKLGHVFVHHITVQINQ